MIGVQAREADRAVVSEFFQLFKTPWEFRRPGEKYAVVLCCDEATLEGHAKLVLQYGSGMLPGDPDGSAAVSAPAALGSIVGRIPIYTGCRTFGSGSDHGLIDESSRASAVRECRAGDARTIRIGYHLFDEVRHLLASGQPAALAAHPTMERHIALLREMILGASIPLVEIPPIPEGHPWIACLTHDVDHVGICNHKWDRTLLGFLYRATLGSLARMFRGRMTLRQMFSNWAAACSLPAVHLGLARDFWYTFDRYLEIEGGKPSTYFVVPKKGDPGRHAMSRSHRHRAVQYDAAGLSGHFKKLREAGCEIGLHGLDAWKDANSGRDELALISKLTDGPHPGVRMHWLYFDEQSPRQLEEAGFSYDSTMGYNETVGYRSGTTQVFRPLAAQRLLELPMHVMDTALFYPSYLNCSPREAKAAVAPLLDAADRFGGVFTVNWHDRSIAPERLWDGFYIDLLKDFARRGAWFATATQAVAWFNKRREASISAVAWENGTVRIRASAGADGRLPALRLRLHRAREQDPSGGLRAGSSGDYRDIRFEGDLNLCLPA